jgi:hypothetical protein
MRKLCIVHPTMHVLVGERRVGCSKEKMRQPSERGGIEPKLASLLFDHVVEVVLVCN